MFLRYINPNKFAQNQKNDDESWWTIMNNGYTAIFSPCFSMFLQLFSIFHPFVHVPGAASSCASCASAVRPTPNHASWWEKWAPPACCATRSKCRPDWDATWVLKKTHHSWSWLLFIDYLTIMIQTIVHWLLDYYCLLLLPLLFTIYLSSFPIDYSLITLIHYHWWQTLFIVIWNITINWLLFIDYLTIMIDHSLLMIDTQLQYSRCVINNGEEWTQWWCNEVQWDNHEVIWTIVICNQEPTAIEWIVVDNKRQSRTNGELSIKWVIVNKHQVCNQDSTVDIMNQ